MSATEVKNVIIVGGGTSGWLSAAYLVKQFAELKQQAIKITLVESSSVATIGVGEATIPSIRETLKFLGVSEAEFIKATDATFKQSIEFIDWNVSKENKSYHHNFSQPLHAEQFRYADYWAANADKINKPYAYASTIQGLVADNSLSPKFKDSKDYEGPLNYAYHFDAGKFAEFLKSYSLGLGVQHIVGHVDKIAKDSRGNIASLTLADGQRLLGDLFIDCSGFRAMLIEKELSTEFLPLKDTLFVDSAVTVLRPHKDPNKLPSATYSTAKDSGWIWDIGLQNRRGTGYVFSSKYCSEAEAEQTLAAYHGMCPSELSFRHLKMRTGYRKQQWTNNCVAIGLSAGFLEPLESTGIYLVEIGLKTLASLFPYSGDMKANADQYNRLMTAQFTGAIDFIKLHYVLSDRNDSQFWKDNRDTKSIPDTLVSFLDRSKNKVPTEFDMPVGPQCFSIFSYYSVMFGMESLPAAVLPNAHYLHSKAPNLHQEVESIWEQAKKQLPTHKEIIEHIVS